jgi:hypothetical protein
VQPSAKNNNARVKRAGRRVLAKACSPPVRKCIAALMLVVNGMQGSTGKYVPAGLGKLARSLTAGKAGEWCRPREPHVQ